VLKDCRLQQQPLSPLNQQPHSPTWPPLLLHLYSVEAIYLLNVCNHQQIKLNLHFELPLDLPLIALHWLTALFQQQHRYSSVKTDLWIYCNCQLARLHPLLESQLYLPRHDWHCQLRPGQQLLDVLLGPQHMLFVEPVPLPNFARRKLQ
jgi:hypothetical protein